MPVDTNNIRVEEHIKENRVDGETTSLTIKLVAFDLDALVEFTGDGTYLSHNDCTWDVKTIVGRTYWDFDASTSLASTSMNYTLPVDKRTTSTQDSLVAAQDAEVSTRGEWYDLFQDTEEYKNMRIALGTALSNL